MKSRDDWPRRPQHQHHAAACFMLAAGAASSSQLGPRLSGNIVESAILPVDCASLDPLLSDLMDRGWVLRHVMPRSLASLPLMVAASRAMPAKCLELPQSF
ncbi:hypothetical protein DL98DRAFT_511890 [Cadophora sp. DSE1049]|nr:hypothetical protein DL98DRAFT_511890 [Cadophora sp. DSE1049]